MFKRLVLYVCICLLLLSAACGTGGKPVPPAVVPTDVTPVYKTIPEQGTLTIAAADFKHGDISSEIVYETLLEARRMFTEKHKGWTVEILSADDIIMGERQGGDSPAGGEGYYPGLLNRLRGGGGIDIMEMPTEGKRPFVEEGLLLDLVRLIAEDGGFDMDALLPGVRMALSDETGRLYTMPISFTLNMLYVNTIIHGRRALSADALKESLAAERSRLRTWEALAEFFGPEMERLSMDCFLPVTPQIFVFYILRDYYTYIYDAVSRSYNFNSPVFAELLQTAYDLRQQGLLLSADYEGDFPLNEFNWMLNLGTLSGEIQDFGNLTSLTNSAVYLPIPVIGGVEGLAVRPIQEFAVSADAPEQEAAWEFIKILLSPELQNGDKMRWQPILSAVDEAYVRRALGVPPFGEINGAEVERYNGGRLDFFSNINRVNGTQGAPPIWDIMGKHLRRYFLGEITRGETIDALQREADEIN